MGSIIMQEIRLGDTVWVKTTRYSASKAIITGKSSDGYYVSFLDRSPDQEDIEKFPVLKDQVKSISYIGWEK